MAADAEARIWAAVAASGTGKGLWIKGHLRTEKPARLVVWDFKREYGEFAKLAPSLGAVRRAMIAAGADGPLRIAYCPVGAGEKSMRKEFEALCELVYAWERCTFIAEELSNVTTPGWAPASWRKMTTSGRHAEIHIIGATQMPTLVDKTFLGNCTLIHCGPLREHAHREQMARSLDIDSGRIAALVKFQWIEKDFNTGKTIEGFTLIPGVKAPKPAATPAESAPRGRDARGTPTGSADAGQKTRGAATVRPSSVQPTKHPKGSK